MFQTPVPTILSHKDFCMFRWSELITACCCPHPDNVSPQANQESPKTQLSTLNHGSASYPSEVGMSQVEAEAEDAQVRPFHKCTEYYQRPLRQYPLMR